MASSSYYTDGITPYNPSGSYSQPTGYEGSDDERVVVKKVMGLYDKAKQGRRKYDQYWLDDYKMFRGKQWKDQRPSYRHSEVVNMVFQHIQSIIPILSDARQMPEFLAQDPTDYEFAQILNQVLESDWNYNNWSFSLLEMLYDGTFYSLGVGQIGYDADARKGVGSMAFRSVDPFYVFVDPDAKNFNVECDYVCVAEPKETSKLKLEYPDKAEFIKPDLIDLISGAKAEIDLIRFKSPVDSKTIYEGIGPYSVESKSQTLKLTAFYKDKETEALPLSEGETAPQTKLKYPFGRRVVVVNNMIVEDEPMICEYFPFIKYDNYVDPHSFYGINEIEQLRSTQRIYNKIISYTLDVLTLMGNPIWVIDNSAGIDKENLVNRPGLIVGKTPGSEVRREEGVQIPGYVLQLMESVRQSFNQISGSQEVSRGVRPEGITAASAIQSLQEAAQTRLRQKSRQLDYTLQMFGQIYLEYMFHYYSVPRIVRVTNNQNAEQYFKFHIETSPDGQKVARVRPYDSTAPDQYTESTTSKDYPIKGSFDVRIDTGSALPFAKDAKLSKYRQAFLDGVIDREAYQDALDIPGMDAIRQRMEQAAAAAPPGAPAPAPAK